MNVLMIGTGNMTRGIATRLLVGGHDVILYNPDRSEAETLADELRASAGGGVRVASDRDEAVAASQVVILASWYSVNLETARELGDRLEGKVVIDISNPLNESYDGLVTEGGLSAAENIDAVLPEGANLVKAFNTTFAATLVDGAVAGHTLDVLVAGNDEDSKELVSTLVTDGGLNAIDVGGLERARQLEALGLLGITLQSRLDTGFTTAWKLVLPREGQPAA